MGFDKKRFVDECVAAVAAETDAHLAVRDIVARAVERPGALEEVVGPAPDCPSWDTWYLSDDLTILHIVWPPEVDLYAHDHNLWAIIGLYGGREDNFFYRRTPDNHIEPSGGRTLMDRDVLCLGSEAVHSVANPTRQWTAALHVYGGNFFEVERTMWDRGSLSPAPFDADATRKVLEEAAAIARASVLEHQDR